MEKIIDPVPVELLKAELTPERKLEDTNKGNNEIYIVNWHNAPNVVTEIGRLREIAFREAGGSTGLAIDLDEYDKMETPYQQMVIWDPDEEAILGGYRFILGKDVKFDENGQPIMATAHQFDFSRKFIEDYLPYTMELGRSFVSLEYQSSRAGAKAIFSMDNLWDGIVAILMQNPETLYFFGKVTIYHNFDQISKDLIYHFLNKHFCDHNNLVRPQEEFLVTPKSSTELMDLILYEKDIKEDFKLLKTSVRRRGVNIPPLVNSYMSISPRMVVFGTSVNVLMDNLEDTAILIAFDEIYDDKKHRHVGAFLRYNFRKRPRMFPLFDPQMESVLVEKWMAKRGRFLNRMLSKRKNRK